ncbi:MAG: hypothetical protein GF330_14645, partial [Candidatus Eisenbacteria bacterium]|nr:hypothetical protein [Candidatus Eisenbacteria bacterium]
MTDRAVARGTHALAPLPWLALAALLWPALGGAARAEGPGSARLSWDPERLQTERGGCAPEWGEAPAGDASALHVGRFHLEIEAAATLDSLHGYLRWIADQEGAELRFLGWSALEEETPAAGEGGAATEAGGAYRYRPLPVWHDPSPLLARTAEADAGEATHRYRLVGHFALRASEGAAVR